MIKILLRFNLLLMMIIATLVPVSAREGDTLLPIETDAPTLQTWPENLLHQDDAGPIEGRVREARTSGVPLAVRIVNVSLPEDEIPFHVRQYVRQNEDNAQFSQEQLEDMAQDWAESEAIETSEEANDGFLLLVLVPEDRTQTQAVWWSGPNALPINGLTQENILATHTVMNQQFAEGNMPYGVYLGLSEFSYNIQFGVPDRLERSELQNALHMATVPMAIVTAAGGIAVPILALVLSRRRIHSQESTGTLTAWQASALHIGRARAQILTAMLLDCVHRGELSPLAGGGLRIEPGASGSVIDVLRPFANDEGHLDSSTIYEIEAITMPVRDGLEDSLAGMGAMTLHAKTDRTWMLLAMGLTAFFGVLTVVPSVISMSAIGVFAIALAGVGIGIGWWWLGYRRYTTPAGEKMLMDWIESASVEERSAFDLVVHQHILTDQDGGPDVTNQKRLMRQLRGLGST